MTEQHENLPRDEKILGMLGLASKAGKLLSGAEKLADASRSGVLNAKSGFIVIASDASARTKKNIALAADEAGIRRTETGADMLELGRRTGGKGPVSAVAVTDKNLAGALEKLA